MAEKLSLPPLALRTRFFARADVDGEGGGVEAVEADAGAVGGGGEDFGPAAAVDLDGVVAGAAFVQVGVVARIPDHAVVARLAEDLVIGVAAGQRVVRFAAEQEVEAALAEQRVIATLAEELVVPRAADNRIIAGAAEQRRGAAERRWLRRESGGRCRADRKYESRQCWLPSAFRLAPPQRRR